MRDARIDGLPRAQGGHAGPATVPARVAGTSEPAPPTPLGIATGVVVGVDGSLSVLGAVSWAAAHAASRGLALHLVQVLPPTADEGPDAGVPYGRARALLHRAMGAVSAVAPRVPMTAATVHGSVGPALVNYAAHARMLVVGSRGAGGPIPLSPGRILAQVSAHARCPMVVIPPKWTGSWASTPSARPVLVGVDGSLHAEHALAYAAAMADRLGVALRVLTARTRHPETEQPPAGHGRGERLEPAEEHQPPLLAQCLDGCREYRPGLTIEPVVVTGDPAQAALLAAGRRAQLIVVGSRGRGAVTAALLGSTSETVLCHSPCPVMLVSPVCAEQVAAEAVTGRAERALGVGGGLDPTPGW